MGFFDAEELMSIDETEKLSRENGYWWLFKSSLGSWVMTDLLGSTDAEAKQKLKDMGKDKSFSKFMLSK